MAGEAVGGRGERRRRAPAADGLSALVSTAWKVTAERSSSAMISASTGFGPWRASISRKARRSVGPAGEVGAEQRLPALDDRLRRLGEAVAGQVDEVAARRRA